MSRERWERLAGSLEAAGIAARIDERSYPGGVSRSMVFKAPGGVLVHVHDTVWRKNHDVWTGYEVYAENAATAITIKTWPKTKKRSEVVAAVASLVPARPWRYGRIGIPGECYAGSEAEMRALAEAEASPGPYDRADMFLVTPGNTVLVPADRSNGSGIDSWGPAGAEVFADLAANDWADGEWLTV